ncbi:colgalt1 [Symbiodinium necroappetens]|uniref:Colgalt1 protein n=1 Tax=Symbiodinium necroappetens TaxID=1628268 RepID=A0A812KL79_9DINO|nr:colgalt1 [Symbiodinium necroappetens]
MVRFVRPGLLRTTSLSRTFSVLLELCRAESSAETAQAFLQSTESADRVGAFISHSWRAKPLPKVLALCYELNVSMAVKACWLTWLAVSLLLLASAGGTSEDTRDILGSIETSPWVFFFTVDLPLIVFVMFFFFAHGLTFEFWTPSVWFDKACINQEDQDEKEEAIAILPEILQQSSRILVVWDPTLFSRLWCNLEIATFAKSHREDPDAIRILQPWITPWLLCSLFAEWLAARVLLPWYGQLLTAEENLEWHPGSFMDYLVAGLISNAPFVVLQLPALWISAVFFSYKLRCSADILDAFANFDVRNAQCSMSSDRGALHAQIARVFDEIEDAPLSIEVEVSENFPRSPPKADPVDPELVELIRRPSVRRITSYPSEEMCLDLFNTFVRNELRCQIVEETGRPSHLPLGLAILGALPLQLWMISDIYLQCEQVGCKTVPMFYYLNSTDQYWVFVSVSTFYDTVLAKPLLYTAALHTLDRVYSIGASCALEWLLIIPAMALVQLCCYFFEALVTGCMEYLLAEGVSALPLSLLCLLLFVTTFLWSRAFLR